MPFQARTALPRAVVLGHSTTCLPWSAVPDHSMPRLPNPASRHHAPMPAQPCHILPRCTAPCLPDLNPPCQETAGHARTAEPHRAKTRLNQAKPRLPNPGATDLAQKRLACRTKPDLTPPCGTAPEPACPAKPGLATTERAMSHLACQPCQDKPFPVTPERALPASLCPTFPRSTKHYLA